MLTFRPRFAQVLLIFVVADEEAAAKYSWEDGSDWAEGGPGMAKSWGPVRDKAGGLIYP